MFYISYNGNTNVQARPVYMQCIVDFLFCMDTV